MIKILHKYIVQDTVSYTHLRAHETDSYLVCRLLLEKNLLRTNPKCDYFKKKNELVLPSLEKDSIDEFLKGLLVDTRLLIEPKIDGCAVALQYRDGTLEKAISRKGADVTSKLIKVQDIPNNLPLRGVLQVRGELYAPNQSPNISQIIASGFLRAKE